MSQTPSRSPGSSMSKAYTEALELSLGRVIADARRQVETHKAQSDALIAEMAARLAETEARCLTLEGALKESVDARLAALKDGADADPAVIERMVADAVARIPAPQDGKDADPAEVDALRAEIAETKAAVAAIVIPEPTLAPDLSGLATKDDVAAVRDAIPAIPEARDWSPEIEAVKALIPTIPDAPDLSHFSEKSDVLAVAEGLSAEFSEFRAAVEQAMAATKAELEGVAKSIPAVPEPADLSGFATKADIPEAPDLSAFATKADIDALRGEIPAAPDLSPFATKAELEALPAPQPGKDADMEEVARLIGEQVSKAVAAIPPAKDGADADLTAILRHVEETVAAAIPPKESLRGPAGRLPAVKAWADGVHYEGAVVAHKGSLYQASVDTGREPPHADWTCLAARGENGRSIDVRGTYEDGGEYRRLDIVALNGGSFIALRDSPGACPGDGWQLLAGRGKPGQAVKGEPGPRGLPGAPLAAALVSEDGAIILTNGDGSEVEADLYPLLSRVLK